MNNKKFCVLMVKYLTITTYAVVMLNCAVIGFANEYSSSDRRDPFVSLVGVQKETVQAGSAWNVFSIEDVVLQGIVMTPDGTRSAIINGEVINEGDGIDQLLVESVGKNAVVISINGEKHELSLFDEDNR
ncbi:MAG: hypothetical protein ABIH09_02165 [Candidatus Omnitrophota bacterium]